MFNINGTILKSGTLTFQSTFILPTPGEHCSGRIEETLFQVPKHTCTRMKNIPNTNNMLRNQGSGKWGGNSEMLVMFTYPLSPIPIHFQLILPNPTRICDTARSKLTTKVSMRGHLTFVPGFCPQLPHVWSSESSVSSVALSVACASAANACTKVSSA